ncbi:MAG: hypothetical protein PWQ55_2360 [Chloroflexota bacterium]|nr:hypothetical protein [Chloroflexota bacterium]
MDLDFVERPALTLMGMSFYGDPFRDAGDWSENNEIGRLSQRYMEFAAGHRAALDALLSAPDFYEVHIYNPETEEKGLFEVFVGQPVGAVAGIPLELSCKILPAGSYACVHLQGETIISDWYRDFDKELAQHGRQYGLPFFFQIYDQRYKGMDRIAESEIDAFIPVKPL